MMFQISHRTRQARNSCFLSSFLLFSVFERTCAQPFGLTFLQSFYSHLSVFFFSMIALYLFFYQLWCAHLELHELQTTNSANSNFYSLCSARTSGTSHYYSRYRSQLFAPYFAYFEDFVVMWCSQYCSRHCSPRSHV